MIEQRIGQLETDVRTITTLVAQLETGARAQTTEIEHLQGVIGELVKDVADLRTRVERVEQRSRPPGIAEGSAPADRG